MKMKIRYISLLMVIISLMISTNLYAREGRSGLSTHGDNLNFLCLLTVCL